MVRIERHADQDIVPIHVSPESRKDVVSQCQIDPEPPGKGFKWFEMAAVICEPARHHENQIMACGSAGKLKHVTLIELIDRDRVIGHFQTVLLLEFSPQGSEADHVIGFDG